MAEPIWLSDVTHSERLAGWFIRGHRFIHQKPTT